MAAALLAVTWNGQILRAEWCTVDRSVPVWLQGISWTNIMSVMNEITNWFQSNLLTLNCNKTHFLQFLTKNKKEIQIQII